MSHKTGLENYYVIRGQKKLRFGYTTGSCAAGACQGAVEMLLGQYKAETARIMTPKGILLNLELLDCQLSQNAASCAVKKDGGDDPDNTSGLLIYASARKIPGDQIIIDGGKGVGRVTKPGLSQQIGEAAINPVPRSMIEKEARDAAEKYGYKGGLMIEISVPGGEECAKKTFNPRLGIMGGISILGTSGIVEPMSERALVESIHVEMKQRVLQGEKYLLVTPGNYGEDFLREHMSLPFEKNIKCSNYIGETIDMAIDMGVKGILFVAHIGKFVKVAAGIMNTHSHQADGRMEILAGSTTDEGLDILKGYDCLDKTMDEIMKRIQFYLDHHSYEQILLGAVVFSNTCGYLGQTACAGQLEELLAAQYSR